MSPAHDTSSTSAQHELVAQFGDFGSGMASWYCLQRASSDADSNNEKDNAIKAPVVVVACNGIPAACYLPLARGFGDRGHNVYLYHNRSFWPNAAHPHKNFCWHKHAEDLLAFLQNIIAQPAIVIGHSLGGTLAAINAATHPHYFHKLLLIDPAGPPNQLVAFLIQYMPAWIKEKFSIVANARSRRNTWPDRQAFIDSLKKRSVYAKFTEEVLPLYAEHGLDPVDQGYQLKCSPAWEAHIFRSTGSFWSSLPKLSIATLFLRAGNTYLYSDNYTRKLCARNSAHINYKNLPGAGHLAPLEQPAPIYNELVGWLDKQSSSH